MDEGSDDTHWADANEAKTSLKNARRERFDFPGWQWTQVDRVSSLLRSILTAIIAWIDWVVIARLLIGVLVIVLVLRLLGV